jgi:hypothetical protein
MKNIIRLAACIALSMNSIITQAQTWVNDSVNMGPGIQSEVFYSLKNGSVSSGAINSWELAHTQVVMDNCIRANHVAGIRVVLYPKGDISNWNSFDTSGWSQWRMVFNDIHKREKGAFNQQPGPGMWDFNWGVYNPSTHEVVGDSLYLLIRNAATTPVFKKFWPVKQDRNGNLHLRMANLDGSEDTTFILTRSSGDGKNYKYAHLGTLSFANREPAQAWDLLFTQYFAPTYDPRTQKVVPYPVMGVESNSDVLVAEITKTHRDDVDLSAYQMEVKDDLTGVGADWKKFNEMTFRYTIVDSLTYLVRAKDGEYWLLSFTRFGGSATGKVFFSKQMTNLSSTNFVELGLKWNVYPNPVKGSSVQVATDLSGFGVLGIIDVLDVQGRVIHSEHMPLGGLKLHSVNINGLKPGIYHVRLQAGGKAETRRLVIQ